jgi:hypothetical protein
VNSQSSLSGYNHEPRFIEPTCYDVLVYPAEWLLEGLLPDFRMRQVSPSYYNRNWGKSKVVCLQTLFYTERVRDFFLEDPTAGLNQLIKSGVEYTMFSSDGMVLLQEGRVKELGKDYNKSLTAYTACPLLPSEIDNFKIYKIGLGNPIPAAEMVSLLSNLG